MLFGSLLFSLILALLICHQVPSSAQRCQVSALSKTKPARARWAIRNLTKILLQPLVVNFTGSDFDWLSFVTSKRAPKPPRFHHEIWDFCLQFPLCASAASRTDGKRGRRTYLSEPCLKGLSKPGTKGSFRSWISRRKQRGDRDEPSTAVLLVSSVVSSFIPEQGSMEKYRLVQEHKGDGDDFLEPTASCEVRITQQGKPRNYISYAMSLFVSS